jgi:ZIP family zinc transporter
MEQEHDHVVNNVGVAFGLVIGAGLSTALGASVVFFPSVVKLASRRILASGLGLSAGVMIYVSLVEIFGSSTSAFQEAGHSEEDAYLYSTLCFFAGVAVMLVSFAPLLPGDALALLGPRF